jgi:hypothetical protein
MRNKLMKYSLTFLVSALLSTQTLANFTNISETQKSPWAMSGSLGMAQFESTKAHQGQTSLARFGLNYALTRFLGLEAGIQNGNQMRFDLPQESEDILGGMPVSGTIKPQLDLLFTVKTPKTQLIKPLYAQIKAGMAYRQLQMDRDSINDLQEFSPELQVGLGFAFNERLDFSLMYQQVFGQKPKFVVDALRETASIANIPSQKALMLGLTYCLE